jgi:hypothetical protein
VIWQISQGGPIFADAVSDSWPWMDDEGGGNVQAADLEASQGDVVKGQTAWKITQTDWE